MIKSESTKNMTAEETKELQEKVKMMSPLELKEFRNQFDPDSMGYSGEEGFEDEN